MPLLDDLALPRPQQDLERRKFLGLLGSGSLGVAAMGTGITAIRYLEPNVVFEEEARFSVGRPEEIAPGTVLVLPRQKVFVVRARRGFFALSATCTHLGCMTRHEPDGFACPCHGSRFSLEGGVTAGPAPRPLPRLAIFLERGVLVVDARRRVADDFVLEVA